MGTFSLDEQPPEELVKILKQQLLCMTPEQRFELLYELNKDYCVHCGSETPCHCWNDD